MHLHVDYHGHSKRARFGFPKFIFIPFFFSFTEKTKWTQTWAALVLLSPVILSWPLFKDGGSASCSPVRLPCPVPSSNAVFHTTLFQCAEVLHALAGYFHLFYLLSLYWINYARSHRDRNQRKQYEYGYSWWKGLLS